MAFISPTECTCWSESIRHFLVNPGLKTRKEKNYGNDNYACGFGTYGRYLGLHCLGELPGGPLVANGRFCGNGPCVRYRSDYLMIWIIIFITGLTGLIVENKKDNRFWLWVLIALFGFLGIANMIGGG